MNTNYKPSEEDLIDKQWKVFSSLVDRIEDQNRKRSLQKLCDDFAVRIMTCPASTATNRVGAFAGGLVWHSLNVTKTIKELNKLYDSKLTTDEIITVGLFHDIGKIGNETMEYYLPQTSRWHADNGMVFEVNKKLEGSIANRTIWFLMRYGIDLNERELAAILAVANIKEMYANEIYNAPILSMILQQSVQACCVKNRGISNIYDAKIV
jgi:hypothetical protein